VPGKIAPCKRHFTSTRWRITPVLEHGTSTSTAAYSAGIRRAANAAASGRHVGLDQNRPHVPHPGQVFAQTRQPVTRQIDRDDATRSRRRQEAGLLGLTARLAQTS